MTEENLFVYVDSFPVKHAASRFSVRENITKKEKNERVINTTVSSVSNFQFMESPVELNSLLSKFFCCITWFVISLD